MRQKAWPADADIRNANISNVYKMNETSILTVTILPNPHNNMWLFVMTMIVICRQMLSTMAQINCVFALSLNGGNL